MSDATTAQPTVGPCPVCGHDMANPERWIALEAMPSDELLRELQGLADAAMAQLLGDDDYPDD